MRIDVTSFVPSVVIVEDAAHHDSKKASEFCFAIRLGDILVADKAYLDFSFLHGRGVFFVLRQKENMSARDTRPMPCGESILADEAVELYRARWSVKIFFQELKQTLPFADFIETSKNAVK